MVEVYFWSASQPEGSGHDSYCEKFINWYSSICTHAHSIKLINISYMGSGFHIQA